MTPVDVQARMRRLARQYPGLVDLVDLPNRTNGYRRTAAAYVGQPGGCRCGGRDEGLRLGRGQRTAGQDGGGGGAQPPALGGLSRPTVLIVTLATGPDGSVISTTDQVAAFIAAKYPQRFNAFVEDGSAGKIMPVWWRPSASTTG